MSQLSYRDGYRQGVLAATQPLNSKTDTKVPLGFYQVLGEKCDEIFNTLLTERKKKLLSKKVTKWVNVGRVGASVSDPAAVQFGYGVFYDDQGTAETNVWSFKNYIGTYPVEIEEEY